MSLQTIVTAVIVLLVAAILIILVGTKLGAFNQSISDCTSKGGECRPECGPGEFPGGNCGEDSVCCLNRDGLNDAFGGN